MRAVTIQSRLGETKGYRNEELAYFDLFDPGAEREVRHFILLQCNIKLIYEPWGKLVKEWYADLIAIDYVDEDTIKLTDLYLDLIIEGNGPTYRTLDFDDLAEALLKQEVTAAEIEQPLKNLQKFLDNHLHKGKDFPPAVMKEYL